MRKFFLFIAALCCAVTMNATEGAIRGGFTINEQGDKIQFSQGNLQYQASTDTWRFAINQWDTIGAENANISETYSGWIDLFGFSTGNKPTERSKYADNYDTSFEHDWGANAISNGGNEPNLWRTMSPEEWAYIFHERPNAAHRLGLGTVNGVQGIIFLPDDWEKPVSLDFASFAAVNMQTQWSKVLVDLHVCWYGDGAVDASHWSDNVYASDEWQLMEQAGAIFLPAAGLRYDGTKMLYVNTRGDYRTSHPQVAMEFDSYQAYSGNGFQIQLGGSVRLVQPYDEHQDITSPSLQGRSGEAHKTIKDGQLLILRGDKMYTIQGQEVK